MADNPTTETKEIDARLLELLERRFEEKVLQRVEATLKWRYTLLGAVFVAALGVAGIAWNQVVADAVASVARKAEGKLDESIRKLAQAAEESSQKVNVTFAIADRMAKQGDEVIDAAKKKLAAVTPALEAIEQLEDRQKDLDFRTKDLIVAVGSESVPASLDAITAKVARIGEQVDRLSQIIAKMPTGGTLKASDGSTAATVQSDVSKLVQRAEDEVRRSTATQQKHTVFLQFAGAPRPQAQALADKLREAGYSVPPEDREGGAARLREVRFFNQEDADAAENLAAATNQALNQLGYRGLTVRKVDVTKFGGVKPRPGVLELWIELPKLEQPS